MAADLTTAFGVAIGIFVGKDLAGGLLAWLRHRRQRRRSEPPSSASDGVTAIQDQSQDDDPELYLTPRDRQPLKPRPPWPSLADDDD